MKEPCCGKEMDVLIDRAYAAIERAAKLSTKQRKKLKKSQFCGPSRSFPIE